MMNNIRSLKHVFLLLMTAISVFSCKSGPFNLIKPASPHEQYRKKLESVGLQTTAMGATWISNSKKSIKTALAVKLPYQEAGYFSADKTEAIAFKFAAVKGQKLQIRLDKKSADGFLIYLDLWEVTEDEALKLLSSLDTLNNVITYEIENTANYLIRLQPELLGGGSFNLSITTGPSLAYPLKTINRNQIQSLWGVDRDGGARRHEGIDIFSPLRTPVLAIASGTITRVNTNSLGGKVVWLRPQGKNYSLYYAHLDEQTVIEGQNVEIGDTLGRMGNTGNAAGGPPHLHFGIYTNGGAVDPLPFLNPFVDQAPKIYANTAVLNYAMRTTRNVTFIASSVSQAQVPRKLTKGTLLRVTAASGNDYRVELPDASTGYLTAKSLVSVAKPIAKFIAKGVVPVYDQPTDNAAVKFFLIDSEVTSIVGTFDGFSQIVRDKQIGWIKINCYFL